VAAPSDDPGSSGAPDEPGEPLPVAIAPVDGRGAHRGGPNYVAAICRCEPPRRIRAARSILELGPIACTLCTEPFVEA
jgi:hypothetical protein